MNKINEFSVSVYGEITQYNDVLSKARCRILYKGKNRNGSYINDTFADKLLSTLAYVPVKGIYDGDDYTDHGERRDEGRIYGIVPETYNLSWENHIDKDGVERLYACCDVLLFTAIYAEANEIVGKSLSMELYEPSMKYHEAYVDGQICAVFDDACFLGLQALGDDVEPCFEGASFFSLQKSIEDTINHIKSFSYKGGQSEMAKINFKLSDDQKFDALWNLLNPEFTEEGGWMCSYGISSVYDDYALAFSYESGNYERIYYTKDDATNMVEITDRVTVYVVDVTEAEKGALDTLRALNGGTYELVSENLTNADENAAKVEELDAKVEEYTNTISTLETEAEEKNTALETATSERDEAQSALNTLTEEVEGLRAYKADVENQQKEAVIAEYADKLSDEVIDAYKAKIGEYTVLDLDKELAYELKQTNPSVFTSAQPEVRIPKEINTSGIEDILSRYANK